MKCGRHPISQGYNGAPAGMPHCVHEDDSPCRISVHAEANALIFAREDTEGSTLYVTHGPCLECSKLIINAGVDAVVYGEEYRSADGVKLLTQAGLYVARRDC